jgi:hypothetical protein
VLEAGRPFPLLKVTELEVSAVQAPMKVQISPYQNCSTKEGKFIWGSFIMQSQRSQALTAPSYFA